MGDWRKICCPVDFSEPSRAALEEAAELGRRLRAELFLLHVRPREEPAAPGPFAPPARRAAGYGTVVGQEQQLSVWTREAQQLAPGLATSVELSGDPATEIVRFASEFGCDLIVMGTHGRSGLAHLALGSVTEGVLRRATCPVLVVRAKPGRA